MKTILKLSMTISLLTLGALATHGFEGEAARGVSAPSRTGNAIANRGLWGAKSPAEFTQAASGLTNAQLLAFLNQLAQQNPQAAAQYTPLTTQLSANPQAIVTPAALNAAYAHYNNWKAAHPAAATARLNNSVGPEAGNRPNATNLQNRENTLQGRAGLQNRAGGLQRGAARAGGRR